MKTAKTLYKNKLLASFFFSNYFYALCAVVLSAETFLQLKIANHQWAYYLFAAAITIVYYTYTYTDKIDLKMAFKFKNTNELSLNPLNSNQRTRWYAKNHYLLHLNLFLFSIVSIGIGFYIFYQQFSIISTFQIKEWVLAAAVPLTAILYKGHYRLPFKTLRSHGLIKPFIVGFVWAGLVTIYPYLLYNTNDNTIYLFIWFFLKNWMFISVLAIMFDIKDYSEDANNDLKTLVVSMGLKKTIFNVLLPLTFTGLVVFHIFALFAEFKVIYYVLNLLPFLLLLRTIYSFNKRKEILYYLIIIDGLMLIKGLCGILSVILTNTFV